MVALCQGHRIFGGC